MGATYCPWHGFTVCNIHGDVQTNNRVPSMFWTLGLDQCSTWILFAICHSLHSAHGMGLMYVIYMETCIPKIMSIGPSAAAGSYGWTEMWNIILNNTDSYPPCSKEVYTTDWCTTCYSTVKWRPWIENNSWWQVSKTCFTTPDSWVEKTVLVIDSHWHNELLYILNSSNNGFSQKEMSLMDYMCPEE